MRWWALGAYETRHYGQQGMFSESDYESVGYQTQSEAVLYPFPVIAQ